MGVASRPRSRVDLRTARLLDANLNRAREGLRVVEDAARFLWNDKRLFEDIRSLRHRLDRITRSRYVQFVRSRECQSDVGRRIKEGRRSSVASVVFANVRRVQEGVRVLEEFSKVFSPEAASEFKKIRYAVYNIEKKVVDQL